MALAEVHGIVRVAGMNTPLPHRKHQRRLEHKENRGLAIVHSLPIRSAG